MSKRQKVGFWIVVVLGAAAFVAYLLMWGGPAGPIIVIEPEQEGGSASPNGPVDFTRWSVEKCRQGVLDRQVAKRDYSYSGVPSAVNFSASTIVVKLKDGHEYEAATIIMGLDTHKWPLTITRPMKNGALDPDGVPNWNFGEEIVRFEKKAAYEWSHDLYGHITQLDYIDTAGKTQNVLIGDLDSIRIVYKPTWTCP